MIEFAKLESSTREKVHSEIRKARNLEKMPNLQGILKEESEHKLSSMLAICRGQDEFEPGTALVTDLPELLTYLLKTIPAREMRWS